MLRAPPMRPFFPFFVACVLIPCLGVNPAAAAPTAAEIAAKREPRARAAELLQRGTDLHGQGKCEHAVIPLESAWALEKNPTTATLLGECEIKLARWVAAARHLGFVLQDKQEGPERARIDTLFKQARAQVGGVTVQSTLDGADVFAESQLVGRTPLHFEVFVEPGDVTMSLKKTSFGEVQRVIHVDKGSAATIRLDPEKVIREDDRLAAPEARSRLPIFVFAGVALAAAGAGVGLRVVGGSQGKTADDALAELTTTATPWPCRGTANIVACQGIKDARSKHDGFVNGSTALFVLGGAALAASITYAIWPSESVGSAGKDRAVSLAPAVSPSTGGVVVQGTF